MKKNVLLFHNENACASIDKELNQPSSHADAIIAPRGNSTGLKL